ncbi:MAG: gluconate 2-dehydrogenase subunit 3 family protein [Deltaproteobacteria bacterium]|nr:gluconate 2-dehydrogenase subunit 3 family protein [Deltaproteobacteria bacterium]MBW2384079.1 gluconate 2-dehydrogenase subunit 3 family protein [Deltaproteobacteria bacterium]
MSLGPEEQRTLASVLDTILPPSKQGQRAGAGGLGLVNHIQEVLAESPIMQPIIASGLAAAQAAARRRGAGDFETLPQDARQRILEEISAEQPDLLPSLTFHGYVGYYQHPDVIQTLGLEPRPPHPKGYEIEESDLSLLDPVRARPKLYRE